MVVQAFSPSSLKVEVGGLKFEASLVYTVNSRIARDTERNSVLKSQKKKKNGKRKTNCQNIYKFSFMDVSCLANCQGHIFLSTLPVSG